MARWYSLSKVIHVHHFASCSDITIMQHLHLERFVVARFLRVFKLAFCGPMFSNPCGLLCSMIIPNKGLWWRFAISPSRGSYLQSGLEPISCILEKVLLSVGFLKPITVYMVVLINSRQWLLMFLTSITLPQTYRMLRCANTLECHFSHLTSDSAVPSRAAATRLHGHGSHYKFSGVDLHFPLKHRRSERIEIEIARSLSQLLATHGHGLRAPQSHGFSRAKFGFIAFSGTIVYAEKFTQDPLLSFSCLHAHFSKIISFDSSPPVIPSSLTLCICVVLSFTALTSHNLNSSMSVVQTGSIPRHTLVMLIQLSVFNLEKLNYI